MKQESHCCAEMARHLKGSEVAVVYLPRFREYGIRILDGGSSIQEIRHCPWCGVRLPESLRERWLGELEALGLEPGSSQIPTPFLSSAWWQRLPTPGGAD